jgi:hypothetical protein
VEHFLLNEFHDREFVEANQKLLDTWIEQQKADPHAYRLQSFVRYRLDTMEALGMDQEEKDAFMRQFPDLGTIRKYFLDQALEREQYDTAIGMLCESIELDGDYAGLVLRLKALRSYPDGGARTRALAEEWRSEYPRRSAMLGEMKQAGF